MNETKPEFSWLLEADTLPAGVSAIAIEANHQQCTEIEAFPRTMGLPFTEYTTESNESAPGQWGNGGSRSDNPFHALKQLKEKPH
jgi:hypothetical protein